MITVTVKKFTDWRIEARHLIIRGVPPENIYWQAGAQESLFAGEDIQVNMQPQQRFAVSAEFLTIAKAVSCYKDDRKWSLLYRVLWRMIVLKEKVLMAKADADTLALYNMQKSVNRDMHKMKAFVRFRKIEGNNEARSEGYYTAWFEPEHFIVKATAPFFMRRFTGMHWSILTPVGCAHWDQKVLSFTEGTVKPTIANDEMDDFWRVYYCSIFNPARLKEKAMQAEMPKKYWKYLPEAREINALRTQSAARVDKMLANDATSEDRLRKRSKKLREAQDELRDKNKG